MSDELYAVVLADVVNSSARTDIRRRLTTGLDSLSERHQNQKLIKLPYAITAGDEFQTVAAIPASIPRIILDLRTTLQPLSLRIGVGFGSIFDRITPPVNRLTGPAFQSARHAIKSLAEQLQYKFDVATAFHSPDQHFDQTINLIYGLHDTLALKTSAKQWESIGKTLRQPDDTLEQTAKSLGVNISTVSRNLKRGYYWQMLETVKVAEALIKETFK